MRTLVYMLSLLLAMAACTVAAQQVPALSQWVATIDDSTQTVVLRWSASSYAPTWGYHICTGQPCVDYDTVFGRTDTVYCAADHSPLEAHTYRIHVFDSAGNVSPLTPPFGNIVLLAEVPECSTAVEARWTPYAGMPSGVGRYMLMVRLEPTDSVYDVYYTCDTLGPLSFAFDIPSTATAAQMRVIAVSADRHLVSESNTVSVQRRTADTAALVEITQAYFDSLSGSVVLSLQGDSAYTGAEQCTLWRSIDGSAWLPVAELPWPPPERYSDMEINRYDSLHCYQLSVVDGCGSHPKYSSTRCVVVPDPPPPTAAAPTAIIAGADGVLGEFLPRVSSLMGDLYELEIFDRRGVRLFSTTNPSEAWCPDSSVPQGAYAYRLRLRFANNNVQTFAGTVLVIR